VGATTPKRNSDVSQSDKLGDSSYRSYSQSTESSELSSKTPVSSRPSTASSFSSMQPRNTARRLSNSVHEWMIDYADLTFEKEVGSGAYGVVYLGTWHATKVAIKQINSRFANHFTSKEDLEGEAAVMASLRPHPNIVTLLGITLTPNPLCIVTEFCPNGSLSRYIESKKTLEKSEIIQFLQGIASGMMHLHQVCKVIHRDLATRNVLLSANNEPKIGDFGMSRYVNFVEDQNNTQSNVGPLRHMAPECIIHRSYSIKSDVWAFAITVIEILNVGLVYPELSPLQMATKVASGELVPSLPKPFREQWSDLDGLINQCTEFDLANRPSFVEIVKFLKTMS